MRIIDEPETSFANQKFVVELSGREMVILACCAMGQVSAKEARSIFDNMPKNIMDAVGRRTRVNYNVVTSEEVDSVIRQIDRSI